MAVRYMAASVALAALFVLTQQCAGATGLDTWRHECKFDQMTDEQRCNVALFTQSKVNPTREIYAFSFSIIDGQITLLIVNPNVIFESALIRVNKNPAIAADFCGYQACAFGKEASRSLANQFQTGDRALVRLRSTYEVLFEGQISLKGFAAEFAKLKQ